MESKQVFNPVLANGIPEITPEEFRCRTGEVTLVDVRRPDEFWGELSHISGAKLITLGPDLDAFLKIHPKNAEIVFVCRSGGRSGQAALQSRNMGFSKSASLQGGMLLWNERKYPVEGKE